jgi:hypothetical protein
LNRWIDPGEYTVTVGAITLDVEAAAGPPAAVGVFAFGGIDYTGTADSSTAVQAKMDAVPAGGLLIFGPGTVRCTSTLTRTAAQGEIHFVGAGAGSGGTTLKLEHATTGMEIGTFLTDTVGVSFDHIGVRGNGATPTTLVKMSSCWVVSFSADTELYDAPLLLDLNTCGHVTFSGVINWNTAGSQVGFKLVGCTDVKLDGSAEGISGGHAKLVYIVNTLCKSVRLVGFHASGEFDTVLHIDTGGADGVTVTGCVFMDVKVKAIINESASSTGWRIVGNRFKGSGATHGIHCTTGTDIVETDNSFTGFTNEVVIPTPTVASAATITLPGGPWTQVTGTTTITSIAASRPGRTVTLQFTGALTLTDGSNLKLAGNYVTSADDTITLLSDGTNWVEVARSGAV